MLRDGTEVAAWVFKANPDVWDVEGHLARHGSVERWCVVPGYRGDLLAAGQPAVLWLTGRRAGVIAVGTVTGGASCDLDPVQGRLRRWAPVRLVAVDPVHKATLLADPRFQRPEVVRTPRLGSPLALTRAELDAVEESLG
ncbi:MAG: hypothetical protein AVDCRST_MAG76-1870 [uncultured Acidimicrobiales bacterium]|uniref:Uncharacterized protein n=1 Tax=uncultured Acidimicrobiales bacterium TaxID=310071 RepID=A0A6J4I7B0_9ACTN|nr:MAG: hypothetical protein AVDCRST_MAG76-1870 [uncultured Acidimicrobiales bacterium]